jgi:hypothetical protein
MNARIDPFYCSPQHNAPGGAANVTGLTDQKKLIWLISQASMPAILNRFGILADQQLRRSCSYGIRAATPFV